MEVEIFDSHGRVYTASLTSNTVSGDSSIGRHKALECQ